MEGKNKIKTKLRETEIGKISEEWEELRISEVCDITSSKRIFLKEYVKSGIPFYRSKEIILKANNNEIVSPLFITEEKYQEIKTKFGVPQEGDILLTSVGTLGIPYCIGVNEIFYFKDGNLTWFKDYKDNLNNRFLLYWLRSPLAKRQVEMIAIGSTQRALTIDALKKMVICIPKYDEQCRIVEILSDLDFKIELNNKMNKTLETIGQAIFRHWFVDFEFPNNEGKPYKSSGGEMVDSELGEMPKGWFVGPLGGIMDVASGRRPGNKSDERDSHFCIPLIGASSVMGYVKESLCNERILVIGRVGTHGIVQRIMPQSFPSDNTLIIKSRFYEYTYQILKTINYHSLNVGTTQPLITQSSIKNLRAAIPPESILKQFERTVSPLFKKVNDNNNETEILSDIRDSLLSRLMSGRIRVKF